MMFPTDSTVTVNGIAVDLGTADRDPLVRAVLLSLFTWRRAELADVEPGESRLGWCGDTLAPVTGDKHGSRLWLLARQNVTARTIQRAKEYTEEALQWMVDDGVCATFEVIVERFGRNGIAVGVVLYRADRRVLADLRFSDVWGAINA